MAIRSFSRRGLALAIAAVTAGTAMVTHQATSDTTTTLMPTPRSGPPRLIAWNDLGMHCIDPDFSVFAILPPANTLNAQLVVDGRVRTPADGYSLHYEAIADATGSINTTSIGKTNFWNHVDELFGVTLAPDTGLAGNMMPGPSNTPQPMAFDTTWNWFHADWIPVTPIDDAGRKNPYPLFRVSARNAGGAEIASTVTVAPNSSELECSMCHASDTSPFARPAAGWVHDPDPLRDDRLNILRLHDELEAQNPVFAAALASAGYDPNGLHATATGGNAVFCARCHASNALPNTGITGIQPLTQAIHGRHAHVADVNGVELASNASRASCYVCHPGFDTQCLRGAMGKAIGADGDFAMQCQSCHEGFEALADPARVGWLDQPTCQNCHSGTATHNNGAIRYTSVLDPLTGDRRVAVDDTYATTPDIPAAPFSLYRFSDGHGGLQCSACHGPPHAIYPTNFANDNVQSQLVQGHVGTITDCTACHDDLEDDEWRGPHGMHPIGDEWARNDHGDNAEHGGLAECRACHGANDRGTVLSLAQGDRTIQTRFGVRTYFRGARISCYDCHNGPNSESPSPNAPPTVQNLSRSTPTDTPLPIVLTGTDPNGDPLEMRVISQPSHGTVAFDGSTATYLAGGGYTGPDSFTYAAYDGKRNSNLATVTLQVVAPACAGSSEEYGFGCPGSNDALPRLSVTGCPTPGSPITLRFERGVPGTQVAVLVGQTRDAVEVAPGCTLRVGLVGMSFVMPAVGAGGTSTLTIPLSPLLGPDDFALQAFSLDPTPGRFWSASNGLALHVR